LLTDARHSRHSHLSLSRCIKDIWSLQPHQSPRRCISLHVRLWAYYILPEKSRLRVRPCGSGKNNLVPGIVCRTQDIEQILVRLNLFTLLLAYAMNTDYISYYFAPLVSLWYLIIYATMAVGSKYNERTAFLIFKIVLSAGAVTWFMREPAFLETLFEFLRTFFGIRWSARECAFRVNLDLYIVYVGMLAALSVIKIREHRLADHPQWPLASKIAIGASGAIILWFFAFELYQESKFTYNAWHPYVSFLPILAFVTLRNANAVLRSGSSMAFTFIGRCSLETFTIQFHFWLAADTKGILLVLPGTRWRPLNFVLTSVMFVYISHRVALATSQITYWICGTKQQERLPTTAAPYIDPSSSASRQAHRAEETIPLSGVQIDGMSRKNGDRETIPPEPDTPIRPMRRWADRLAEGQHQQSEVPLLVWWGGKRWSAGVKLLVATLVMWVMNMMWTYPS
jgi:N-acetylneuraminate 9-O-acetyltransferase